MKRILAILVLLGLIGAGAAWVLTAPDPLPEETFAGLTGNPAKGEAVFWAAGCASCHMAAEAEGEDQLKLGG